MEEGRGHFLRQFLGASLSLKRMTNDCQNIRIVAHRGITDGYTQNSMPALRAAVDNGFDFECDLRTTVDNEVMVIHNAGIADVTDGVGMVADMTAHDIRQYHMADGVSVVPFLTNVLALLQNNPDTRAFLELKALSATGLRTLRDRLTEYGVRGQVVVYSGVLELIAAYRLVDTLAETSGIYDTLPTLLQVQASGGAQVYSTQVNPVWSNRIRSAGLCYYGRIGNDEAAWEAALRFNMPSVNTDEPVAMRAWCAAHA